MDTRAAVEELLRRIGEGDPERTAELYADNVEWLLSWPEEDHGGAVSWIRHRSTRADVVDHFIRLPGAHVPEKASMEIEHILVDGPHAVVTGVVANTVRATGGAYRARFALHMTVEDGRIVRHNVYEDSLAVARACGTAAGA
ncbi:nuclear transport factor 2 family protein [Streptomonospora sp. S1-112]|uniref:Nuclear transport factor 2 family protein n=1 Tax=Streptomonospora mangrovi TaxID=2883123 RepID=A0A9X3NJN7_9ACTN|nr:nuclear transport factor 2 family protein [Streptomonospora mangrovi]MDA0564722.1 nuclear transport factor 2 family protein [Streptomonospora mangrovi]